MDQSIRLRRPDDCIDRVDVVSEQDNLHADEIDSHHDAQAEADYGNR